MKAKRNRVSELTNTELKMIRDELLNGESL